MAKKKHIKGYSHILKYTSLFGGVQVLSIGVALVRNKFVAHLLGPGGMGLVSLFNSTLTFISDSTSFGINLSAVKDISEAYDSGDTERIAHSVSIVRYWSLLTAIFGTLLCIVLSPFLSWLTFSWNGHALHFICLAPIVGLTAITGGETAIIKSVRQLKRLAAITFYNIVAALFISVPIYYFFGTKGIVPSLLLMALAQCLLTIYVSYHLYPLNINLDKALFKEGLGMIKLGTAFVIAGIFTSGTDFVIRSYINNVAGIETVGLYNAGFMMTMTYVSMVFSSMFTDYFPRLSGVNNLGLTFNITVNRQIEVMLLLISPLLVAFTISLPILLPLLYSGKFMPALGMMQVIVFAMYFRAIKLPIEYIPLAKGDSLSYMLLEGIYSIILIVLMVIFFRLMGLRGAGVAITIAAIIDFIMVFFYDRWRYGYHISTTALTYAALQLPIGALTFAVTFIHNPFIYWGAGALLFIISAMISIYIIHTRSNFGNSIITKISGLLNRKKR